MTSFVRSEGLVYHIELRRAYSEAQGYTTKDKLIFSDQSSLKEVNISFGRDPSTLIGSAILDGYSEATGSQARFNQITSFFQVPEHDSIIIVDHLNHCIRIFDIKQKLAAEWVGDCANPGSIDGSAYDARLNRPYSIINDIRYENYLFITEMGNSRIRQMQIHSGYVSTVIDKTNGLTQPSGVAFATDRSSIITCNRYYIGRHKFPGYKYERLAGATEGFADGGLRTAQFEFPSEVLSLSFTVTLVADSGNNRLRVLNEDLNRVFSVCSGDKIQVEGLAANCSLRSPRSLMEQNGQIYVGHAHGISLIRCK